MFKLIENLVLEKAMAAEAAPNFFDFFRNFAFPGGSSNRPTEIFQTIWSRILGWVLVIIALIAFIYLILQGVKYITSGGDAAKATEARNGIINAIIGIVVVVLAWLVVRFAFSLGAQIGAGA